MCFQKSIFDIKKLYLFVLITVIPCFAGAQTLPEKGTAQTLDLATWNIEWFGHASNGPSDDNLQESLVLKIIGESGIDFFAVQEISSNTRFQSVLQKLGANYGGQTVSNANNDQFLGIIYNTQTVTVQKVETILGNDSYYFAGRLPLVARTTIKLNGKSFPVTFINIHAKAGSTTTDYERRKAAAERLKQWIDTNIPKEAVVVMGDFNDVMQGSITNSSFTTPYQPFLDDPARYALLTKDLKCSFFAATYCSPIDHLIMSDELFGQIVPYSVAPFSELSTMIPYFHDNASDHLPVLARFNAPTSTAIEVTLPVATQAVLFPNPSAQNVTLTLDLAQTSAVQVHVFDGLGRRVKTVWNAPMSGGKQVVQWNLQGLANGLYVVQVRTPHQLLHSLKLVKQSSAEN